MKTIINKTIMKLFVLCLILFLVSTNNYVFAEEKFSERYLFKVGTAEVQYEESDKGTIIDHFIHPIVIKENRSMLDIRFFSSSWIGSVIWDVLPHGNYKYTVSTKLFSGKDLMTINTDYTYYPVTDKAECITYEYVQFNDKELKLPVMPIYKGKRRPCDVQHDPETHFLIPLRFIFETFGYTVEWNNDTREITVYK